MIKEIRIDKIETGWIRAAIIIEGVPRDVLINSQCIGAKISKTTISLLNNAFKCILQKYQEERND